MSSQTEWHVPTPEFRSHLEWQIETALRRESRLASPVTSGMHRMRMAALVVAAIAFGGAIGMASGRVQDARQRDQVIERARSEEMLVGLRLELARNEYKEAQRQFEAGTASRETVLQAERQLRAMEMRLRKLQLDIQETQATSATPRDELDAPLVGQRDFVSERLKLELETAQQALTAAEAEAARTNSRFDVGLATNAERLQAEADLAKVRLHMQQLAGTIQLRRRFLSREIMSEEMAALQRRLQLTLQIDAAQHDLQLAQTRLVELRRRVEIGTLPELELKRAEVDLLEHQADLKRLQQELAKLNAIRR